MYYLFSVLIFFLVVVLAGKSFWRRPMQCDERALSRQYGELYIMSRKKHYMNQVFFFFFSAYKGQ